MAFAERFEDLKVWQEARELANAVYDAMVKCRDFDFRSQIQRAAVSAMNNSAEGFERRTRKDFAHFLDLSKGSAGEVRSMLYLAENRKYVSSAVADKLRARYEQLSASIGALASRLRTRDSRDKLGVFNFNFRIMDFGWKKTLFPEPNFE